MRIAIANFRNNCDPCTPLRSYKQPLICEFHESLNPETHQLRARFGCLEGNSIASLQSSTNSVGTLIGENWALHPLWRKKWPEFLSILFGQQLEDSKLLPWYGLCASSLRSLENGVEHAPSRPWDSGIQLRIAMFYGEWSLVNAVCR